MSLFTFGGLELLWKIECGVLTKADWHTIAAIVGPCLHFELIMGVPDSGIPFAMALSPWAKRGGGLLIVDDVITTGGSMESFRDGRKAKGLVLFDRSEDRPSWVDAVWTLNQMFVSND